MKITYLQQFPYPRLPDDFAQSGYESSVNAPWSLVDPSLLQGVYKNALDQLMHAARSGFDGLCMTEHGQSSYDMMPNPNLPSAALAYLTELEGIETAIYPLGRTVGKSHEPLRIAEELAMLDCLSGGRVVAGFPIGLVYDACINYSVPPLDLRARFDENFALILRAWKDKKPFAWNGKYNKHMSVNLWPRPVQDPPPIWITCLGNPQTMEFILDNDYGMNYFGWFGAKLTGRRVFDRFRDIAQTKGLKPNPYQIGFMQMIAVAETDAEAERLYAKHAEYFFHNGLGSIPFSHLMLPGTIDIRGLEAVMNDPRDFGIYQKFRQATYKDLVEAGSIICGSPATVREQLAEFIKDFGIGNLHAMLHFGSMPKELAFYNIDLFAREVMPTLRTLWDNEDHSHYWWPERLGGVRPVKRNNANEVSA